MSAITPFLCSMTRCNGGVGQSIERLAQLADAKQWPFVGVEISRIRELAKALQEYTVLMEDALAKDSSEK